MEPRRLMAVAPLVLTGTATSNAFYIREDADHLHLDVWQNATSPGSGTPTQSVLTSAITTVTLTAAGTTDAVTLDFANGDPFPSTVAVNGLTTATTGLVVTGLTAGNVQVNATTVTVGKTPVAYASLQGIVVDGGSGNDTLTQTAQPLAPLVFAGGTGADTLNINAGTFTLADDPSSATANLTVNDAGNLYFTAAAAGTGVNARHLATLDVLAGGEAVVDTPLSAADRAVLVVGSLSVAPTAKLDLTANDLIVRGGALSALTADIVTGYAAASGTPWSGSAGITSSMADRDPTHLWALGVMSNAGPVYTTFDGQAVAPADVLVKFTVVGDANLDGTVSVADYTRIDAGFISKGGLTGWANGDFDYDGGIDGSDYTLIDNAFNAQSAGLTALDYQLGNALDVAAEQAQKTVAAIGTSSEYPKEVTPSGTTVWTNSGDWTAGTWAGLLWQLYDATGNASFQTEATAFTLPLAGDTNLTGDVGPRLYDAFFPLLQQQPGNATAISVMEAGAATESSIYSPTVGAFKAWYNGNGENPTDNYDVLSDYIMDSQLMFWAAAQTGNQAYYDEAVANATTIETYSVRADGSTAQFAFFNPMTGAFGDNQTYQGYSATSAWSRGSAWDIYGFAQCYAATGRADFLATAEKTANFYLSHLPSDDVPYWDFDDPAIPNAPRDTSAAAIAASGLLQLGKLIATSDPTDSARYITAAGQILASLTSSAYLNSPTAAGDAILLQGASNVPAGDSDSSLTYANYFFVQAINEYLSMQA